MITIEALGFDPEELRVAFGCFPSGVTAVCSLVNGIPVGMAASSFTSVSMDPPMVSVCVQDSSTTWPKLRGLDRLGVSVLAEGQEATCLALSKKTGDRFRDVGWQESSDGAVYTDGASLWINCSIVEEVRAGDHMIVLLRIHGVEADLSSAPLVFHGRKFRRLAALA